jgi:hypothetical protein
MEKLNNILKRINKRSKMSENVESYQATIQGLKDIHDADNPVKYWLSVKLDDNTDRKLFVPQNCRQMNKGDRIKVTGYKIRKQGSINQSCIKIEPVNEADDMGQSVPTDIQPAYAETTQVSSTVPPHVAQWKEKYRLTMSNLLSAALQKSSASVVQDEFETIDKMVRQVLNASYDGEESPF